MLDSRFLVRRGVLLAGLTALGAVAMVSTAYANAITESFAYPSNAPSSYATTNWSTSHTFQGFDALLSGAHKTGTLTSVSVMLTEGLQGTAFVDNTGASNWIGTATLTNKVTMGPVPGTSSSDFVTASATTPKITVDPGTTSSTYALNATKSQTYNYTSNLTAFLSNFDVNVSDTGTQSCTGTGGNGNCNFTDTGYATALITYNYTTHPVPAPSALALFGAGLLGLAGISRFKKRS